MIVTLPANPSIAGPHLVQDAAFECECVTLFSGFLHVLGMPNSIGAIYGLLFASSEPLCFADIVEKLSMSKGSVSQGLTFLRQAGAVNVVEIKGDRREFFEPELALRRLARGLIQEKVQPLAKHAEVAVAQLRQHVEQSRRQQNNFQLERVKQLEIWHAQLRRVLPLVQTILRVPRP